MSNSSWPHGLQHTRFPCPSLSPGVCSNSCPLSQWCHPTLLCCPLLLLSSVFPSIRVFPEFSRVSQHQGFPMSWLFTSCGQSIGASASVLTMNIQGWFPLGLTGLIESIAVTECWDETGYQDISLEDAPLPPIISVSSRPDSPLSLTGCDGPSRAVGGICGQLHQAPDRLQHRNLPEDSGHEGALSIVFCPWVHPSHTPWFTWGQNIGPWGPPQSVPVGPRLQETIWGGGPRACDHVPHHLLMAGSQAWRGCEERRLPSRILLPGHLPSQPFLSSPFAFSSSPASLLGYYPGLISPLEKALILSLVNTR